MSLRDRIYPGERICMCGHWEVNHESVFVGGLYTGERKECRQDCECQKFVEGRTK